MKKLALPLFLGALCLVSCSREAGYQYPNSPSREPTTGRGPSDPANQTPISREERDANQKSMESRLQQIDTAINELRVKAQTAGAETRDSINGALDDIMKMREDAQKKLVELRFAGASGWQETRTEMESYLNDLKDSIDKAQAKFRESF